MVVVSTIACPPASRKAVELGDRERDVVEDRVVAAGHAEQVDEQVLVGLRDPERLGRDRPEDGGDLEAGHVVRPPERCAVDRCG